MYYKGDPLKASVLHSLKYSTVIYSWQNTEVNSHLEFWTFVVLAIRRNEMSFKLLILIPCSQCIKREHNYIFGVQQGNINCTKYATGTLYLMKWLLPLTWCSATQFSHVVNVVMPRLYQILFNWFSSPHIWSTIGRTNAELIFCWSLNLPSISSPHISGFFFKLN